MPQWFVAISPTPLFWVGVYGVALHGSRVLLPKLRGLALTLLFRIGPDLFILIAVYHRYVRFCIYPLNALDQLHAFFVSPFLFMGRYRFNSITGLLSTVGFLPSITFWYAVLSFTFIRLESSGSLVKQNEGLLFMPHKTWGKNLASLAPGPLSARFPGWGVWLAIPHCTGVVLCMHLLSFCCWAWISSNFFYDGVNNYLMLQVAL